MAKILIYRNLSFFLVPFCGLPMFLVTKNQQVSTGDAWIIQVMLNQGQLFTCREEAVQKESQESDCAIEIPVQKISIGK